MCAKNEEQERTQGSRHTESFGEIVLLIPRRDLWHSRLHHNTEENGSNPANAAGCTSFLFVSGGLHGVMETRWGGDVLGTCLVEDPSDVIGVCCS